MTKSRAAAVTTLALVAAAAFACGPKAVVITPQAPPEIPQPKHQGYDLIVLLPDDDTGITGAAVVSNTFGTVHLSAARASTRVTVVDSPSAVAAVTDEEVGLVFGSVLSALPAPPLHFRLYFRFESEELTPASQAELPAILQATRDRPAPEVVVIGHTDTTGQAVRNLQLSLRRANAVRALLIATRLDASMIDVRAHGEAEPLIATGDNVMEARNRRVEITVR
jgi:outer membrane protein OmpA-like peptidoglycan-associated protein